MASNKVDYQDFDDDTTDFIKRLKRVTADISLRLKSLEGNKEFLDKAVHDLQKLGLSRIDATIMPVVAQVEGLLETSQDLFGEAQTLYNDLVANDEIARAAIVEELVLEEITKADFLAPPFNNLLPDSGRFLEGPNRPLYVTGNFKAPEYLTKFNGMQFSDAGHFIYNNSDFGGTYGNLKPIVKDFIEKMKSSSNARRYNYGFHVMKCLSGSGGSYGRTIDGEYFPLGTHSHVNHTNKSITVRYYIKVEETALIFGWSSSKCLIDGIPVTLPYKVQPEDGVVHVELRATYDTLVWSHYSETFAIYQKPNSVVYIAGLGFSNGLCDVDSNVTYYANADTYKQLEDNNPTGVSAIIQDRRSGFIEGGSALVGSWRTRALNTIVRNKNNVVTGLNANQITFATDGVVQWFTTFNDCGWFKTGLFNVNTGVEAGSGTAANASEDGVNVLSVGAAEVLADQPYELRYIIQQSKYNNGLGAPAIAIQGASDNIYSEIKFWS